MFAQYQEEFNDVCREVGAKLSKVNSYSDNPMHRRDSSTKEAMLAEAEELLKQACDLAKQMDVEVRSSDTERQILAERVKPARETLKKLQTEFRESCEKSERDGLLGDGTAARVQRTNDRARQQTRVIRGALEIARETEQVAIDISDELGRNRETIQSIRGHVADTSYTLGAARTLIANMQKRDVKTRLLLIGVGAVLFTGISAAAYFTLR